MNEKINPNSLTSKKLGEAGYLIFRKEKCSYFRHDVYVPGPLAMCSTVWFRCRSLLHQTLVIALDGPNLAVATSWPLSFPQMNGAQFVLGNGQTGKCGSRIVWCEVEAAILKGVIDLIMSVH